jgi:hypothetical protein
MALTDVQMRRAHPEDAEGIAQAHLDSIQSIGPRGRIDDSGRVHDHLNARPLQAFCFPRGDVLALGEGVAEILRVHGGE